MAIATVTRLGLLMLAGCSWLPEAPPQAFVPALPPAPSGDLAKFARAATADRPPGTSVFLRIPSNREGFQWRSELIERATTAIDAQYFIWDDDESSHLLFLRLLDAADRGVRVRLLVDDIFLVGRDRTLAALSKHPRLDIKIFNPGRVRDSTLGAMGEFLLKFRQLNRRMHNKLLVADNRVALVGGRNVGNAYFGISDRYNFRDLDVVLAGPVIEEISHAFDEYWNAELAYPADAMSVPASVDEIEPLRRNVERFIEAHGSDLRTLSAEEADLPEALPRRPAELKPGEAHFLQDDPVPIAGESLRLIEMLSYMTDRARQEFIVVTPYFIPKPTMLESIDAMTDAGVSVKLMTASLASTNHTVAHAHYKKYRRAILETGADLYEFRSQPSSGQRQKADTWPFRADFVSLHSKVIIADRSLCFVGSLNLDPRALDINTENGLLIESTELCGPLADEVERMMSPENAWRVDLDPADRLRWSSSVGARSSAPARGFGQRISDFLYGWLPIEDQI